MASIGNILKLIRPKQWLKNIFVCVPMFFGGSLFDMADITATVVTFFAFCFVASSVYCFNDIIDVEADRRHPVKCKRAIASGAITVPQAYVIMVVMFLLSLSLLLLLRVNRWETMMVILAYYILNLGYCARLKQYAVLDVCIIAFGFGRK